MCVCVCVCGAILDEVSGVFGDVPCDVVTRIEGVLHAHGIALVLVEPDTVLGHRLELVRGDHPRVEFELRVGV